MSVTVPIKTIGSINMADKLQPAKDGYKVTKSDLYSDSTARSAETGKLLAYRIRQNVYSIGLEYVGTAAQIAQVEAALTPQLGWSYQVEFLDNGTYLTKTFYPSDRSKSTAVIINGTPYMSLSVTLVEV